MNETDVRCVGRHPSARDLMCRNRLATVLGRAEVRVAEGKKARPGWVVIPCPRCGTRNEVRPTGSVALAPPVAPVVG